MSLNHFELNNCLTHRLIPSQHSSPVLTDLFDDEDAAADIFSLEAATNRRMLAEADKLRELDKLDLVGRIPNGNVTNAAFCYPSPRGARFNTEERGAWYSSFVLETCIVEVSFHHWKNLQDAGFEHDTVTKDEYLATFDGRYHDMRELTDHKALHPDVDQAYPHGQILAQSILAEDGLGIIFNSLRHQGGTNMVCFHPSLVNRVVKGQSLTFEWGINPTPRVS
ncbi:MAG: RES family NAD+ phosphorylase [Kordiimonadaceae bacterium]|nr:RES family NAD+ phosphorylase [Kordiimonadaceae bacterium]